MSDEYLTDEEQLEHVKRWVAEYGPWIVGAVAVGLLTLFGLRYVQNHRTQRALVADNEFLQMTTALERDDRNTAQQLGASLIADFPDSPYADQARLVLARIDIDDGKDAQAIVPLTDVMEHSKDAELKRIARLRLARVEIDAGKPDDALKTLSDDPGTFAASYHEIRGDAFYAKKDLPQAVREYKEALKTESDGGTQAAILALKIADLGVSPLEPPPAAANAPTMKAKP